MHRICAAALAALLLGGCAGWHHVETSPPGALDRRTVLAFDVGMKHVQLHAVRFTADSVSGVPWLQPPSCDSCRVSFALRDVTHAEAGHPERNFWVALTPVFALFGAAMVYAISYSHSAD
jgi:hypothetical protein